MRVRTVIIIAAQLLLLGFVIGRSTVTTSKKLPLAEVLKDTGHKTCPWCGYPEADNEWEFWYYRDESLKVKEALHEQKKSVTKLASERPELRKRLASYLQDGFLSYFEAEDVLHRAWQKDQDASDRKVDEDLYSAVGKKPPATKPDTKLPYRIDPTKEK